MFAFAFKVTFLLLLRNVFAIPLTGFYKFGADTPANRKLLQKSNDAFEAATVSGRYKLFGGMNAIQIGVSVNGALVFEFPKPSNPMFSSNAFPANMRALVAPFWADVDTTIKGEVHYHETDDPAERTKANAEIRNAFPLEYPAFTATHLFVSTWEDVGYFNKGTDKTNTFQCVLATDGTITIAIFLYADGKMQWTTGDNEGGTNGLGGNVPAQIGFNKGDGVIHYSIPNSRTPAIVDVDLTSNIGKPGVWIFRIDQSMMIQPVTKCDHMGQMYDVGAERQDGCNRCTCQADGKFLCQTIPCNYNSGPNCLAQGDPHYKTFDGNWHHFQGQCQYVHAKPCENNDFMIYTRNRRCGTVVTCVGEVTILIPGQSLTIVLGLNGAITINGNPTPNRGDETVYTLNGVEVSRTSGWTIVELSTTGGVQIKWDGRNKVEVKTSTATPSLCGLCGTNDNRNDNALTARDGRVVTDVNVFGNSWLVSGTGCTVGKRNVLETLKRRNVINRVGKRNTFGINECTSNETIVAEGRAKCKVMNDAESVFRFCNPVVDPADYISNCEFDYCCCDDSEREDCYCASLADYAAVCAEAGVPLLNWRNSYCPIECPFGMVHQECGSLCPRTCDNIGKTCEAGCIAGCFCPLGQVLLDGKCVKPELCTACFYMDTMYQEGDIIQPNCSSVCTCHNREFQCKFQTCLSDGPTCVATGNSHYKTFDGQFFDFQGDCEYVLTKSCGTMEFAVMIGNVAINDYTSVPQTVRVVVPSEDLEIVLGKDGGGTVTINGEIQSNVGDEIKQLSVGVNVVRVGGHLHVIFANQSIRVFWDGSNRVEISISSAWKNKLCGLCGNYNDDLSDDFQTPNGLKVTTVDEFGPSWVANGDPHCGTLAASPACELQLQGEAIEQCSALFGSFFSSCNTPVNLYEYYSNCKEDYCNCYSSNRQECFCNSLSTYASACAAAGVILRDWKEFYCPDTCPSGTAYQQCSSICPNVCGVNSTNCGGGCAEGCFCTTGQVIGVNGTCQPPPQNCQICQTVGIDLVFVIDTSGSIDSKEYESVKALVGNLSSSLTIGPSSSLVGVILFGSRVYLHFPITTHQSSSALLNAISSLPKYGGATFTHSALELLRTSAMDGSLGLRANRDHVAIIITDGVSTSKSKTEEEAKNLHNSKLFDRVLSLGIGNGINEQELRIIASDPSLSFTTAGFSADDIGQLLNEQVLESKICQ